MKVYLTPAKSIVAAFIGLFPITAPKAGNNTPTIGAHGKPIIFLHPSNFDGTLIELQEE